MQKTPAKRSISRRVPVWQATGEALATEGAQEIGRWADACFLGNAGFAGFGLGSEFAVCIILMSISK
jgi:hypothetical protein